ncbi:hypothetical protein QFC22_003574 [Naganishia vaughanmartiniae]|uniref:Uncharacterized protein n=1 Tax=Naganishia vaughanmartiniae TaxID=1424756 RepID=A0ACC2X5N8_9TREE|nr:hypothetical protein QFC22_003574 [Naganishia vaughanmartiniae]
MSFTTRSRPFTRTIWSRVRQQTLANAVGAGFRPSLELENGQLLQSYVNLYAYSCQYMFKAYLTPRTAARPSIHQEPRKLPPALSTNAKAGNIKATVNRTTTKPQARKERRSILYQSTPVATKTSWKPDNSPVFLPPTENPNLAQELIRILNSSSAVAKPSDALNQAIAHHRGNASHSSVETFNLLLAFAARTRNYYALRKVLRDMQAGNVQWDDSTRTFVLKAVLQHPGSPEVSSEVDNTTNGRSTSPANPRADPQTGIHKKKLQGRTALIQRLEATSSASADKYRQTVLNAGRWTHKKVSSTNHAHPERLQSDLPSKSAHSPSESPPAMRLGVLQNAPAPDKARSQLPPHDSQLSPSLFLAFLRYMLACSSNPPSLVDSYQALLALDIADRRVTPDHLLHLTHLYLHPSLYAHRRPYSVITDMLRFTRNGPCAFKPNSQTLQKALYSLRLRQQRARTAMILVRMFRRLWGASIVDLTCWRLVGRYGLEMNDTWVQAFALKGGIAAHQRDRAAVRKSVESRSSEDHSVTTHALVDPFRRHGRERRKWAEVRKAIIGRIRHTRAAIKEQLEAQALAESVEMATDQVEITEERVGTTMEKVGMSSEKGEMPTEQVEMPTEKGKLSLKKASILHG